MDFIERWFHVSPDGGSGASELVIGVAVIALILTVAWRLHRRFPGGLRAYLEMLGKRSGGDRFDG